MPEESQIARKDGDVKVKIINNGLEAVIYVTPAEGEGAKPTVETARKALSKAGVVFGIDERLLQVAISDNIFYEDIVVAKGLPPVDGIDAKIKFFFETSQTVKPKEDEKGNVDYKNINLIQNVKKNQKLAELIPPVPGKEGKSVTGKKILPKIGAMRKLPSGINTELSPNNSNILIASTDGNVYVKGSMVQVDPVFTVNSHVDYSTGNIDYVGSLIIKGDIKAGFTVKSQSEIEILGLVEDATIIAGSNVLIKNGFLGKGNGVIKADGNVMLKYCENQTIEANGDIIVGEYVLNSRLICGGKVEVSGRKGAIVGGYTSAKEGIITRELGNYQEVKTEAVVGIDEELQKKLEEAKLELAKNEENLVNVKKAIYKLIKLKMGQKKLTKEQENLLLKLQQLQSVLPAQRQKKAEEIEKIEEEMKKYEGSEISVEATTYRGVRLRISKYKKNINEETKGVKYQIKDAEIQIIKC